MIKSISWDVYTFIIIALVPGILLAAWGLNEWDERQLHSQQCAVAAEWLQEAAMLAPMFENADTMDNASVWIAALEEINSPARGAQLRHGILSSARYHMEHFPNASTTAGVLHPPNGLFARDIIDGRETLVEHCPETETNLADAFPMVFGREDPS